MTQKNTGFTLVEILIVVIILGILAAIVIPQFTEASNDARVSAVVSDLQTVRSQIELFKVQHLDQYPGSVNGAAIPTGAALVAALTGKTNNTGAIDAAGTLGPYLGKFPTNPFCVSGGNTVELVTGADPVVQSSNTVGWWFNTDTTTFGINSTDYITR
jgi:general secretion pathway protein G